MRTPSMICKTVPVLVVALILCSLLFTQGCSTPMMKATPFYTGEIVYGVSSSGKAVKWDDPDVKEIKKVTLNNNAGPLDSDRINVWPLFYNNSLVYCIVWPIGEINDVGWTIRPLVSVDNYNQSYKAMAYLCGYNAKKRSSYFFPLYAMNEKKMISLLGGWGEDFIYVVPPLFVRNKNYKGEDILTFMFPFSRFNMTTNESYVFPAYLKRKDSFYTMLFGWNDKTTYVLPAFLKTSEDVLGKPGEKENSYHILPPFSGFNRTAGESYIFPLYSYSEREDYFLSLLYGYAYDTTYVMPPCFFMREHPEGNSYNILWPMCFAQPSKNEYYSFPLFYYSDDKEKNEFKFAYLTILGWVWDDKRSYGSLFFPLYLDETTKHDGERMILTPMFMANNGFEDFMTPLFGWFDNGEDYYITPMFIRSRHKDYTDFHIVPPFGNLRLMNIEDENISPVQGRFLPMYSYYNDKDGYELEVMWPLISSGRKQLAAGEMKYRKILPFYYDYSDPDYSHSNYSLFGKTRQVINEKDYFAWYLLPFYYSRWDRDSHYEIDTAASIKELEEAMTLHQKPSTKYKEVVTAARNSFIIPSILISENDDLKKSEMVIIPLYSADKNGSRYSQSSLLWLYTRNEDIERNTVDMQALWYLFYYDWQGETEKQKERSTSRILWKLFHREKVGDEINIDVFPFISYSENADTSRFAFCWRLFSCESGKDSLNVHLLFFPVWW